MLCVVFEVLSARSNVIKRVALTIQFRIRLRLETRIHIGFPQKKLVSKQTMRVFVFRKVIKLKTNKQKLITPIKFVLYLLEIFMFMQKKKKLLQL